MDPFRTPASRCNLCLAEVDSAELALLTGLEACQRCRTGDMTAALEAQGFELPAAADVGAVEMEPLVLHLHVELKRPSRVEVFAHFTAEPGFDNWFSRLFRKRDPEVGVEDFDKAVRIEVDDEYRETLMALLVSAGAREAVARLVGLGCGVSFGNFSVSAWARVCLESSLPELDEVVRLVVALGLHLERFAAG